MSDPLFPMFDADQWERLRRKVREDSVAQMASHNEQVVAEGAREGGCARSVRCRTTVLLARSLANKKGQTEYTGADVDQGTWTSVTGGGGQYIQVTINITIKLDFGDIGENWAEENRQLRQAREQAGMRASFRRIPLEFMLIHEEQHAKDICAALAAIARLRIRCGMTQAEIDAMRDEMQRAYDDAVAAANHGAGESAPGGPQGAVEEDVRRRTWEEWERRHPNYVE